ncbi:MAG: Nuclear envelope morphology protein 1 [Thelocarpon impressellum]|nr:MAG: Nuclear envelope morphology protein 1 [Thelocarpon impressellum]
MNSLNILSARVIGSTPAQTPAQSRAPSLGELPGLDTRLASRQKGSEDGGVGPQLGAAEEKPLLSDAVRDDDVDGQGNNGSAYSTPDEKTTLLSDSGQASYHPTKSSRWRTVPERLAASLVESLRWLLATLAAPGVYLVACLYDDAGQLRLRNLLPRRRRRRTTADLSGSASSNPTMSPRPGGIGDNRALRRKQHSSSSLSSDSSAIVTSDSELDRSQEESPAHHTRSKSQASSSSEDTASTRRSIRIKLYNQENTQKRRKKGGGGGGPSMSTRRDSRGTPESDSPATLTPATLKSPTSPLSSLRMTRYPRAPNPPRPLVPRRTPSYNFPTASAGGVAQKTLILDLDETLIHSMAKGGRMSTGHMVEVKLNGPVGFSGGMAQASRHPILYYVHKRPHCDDFLRKARLLVCRWYNLVAFTASVQEYADPVIDWLEQDRKYFSGRYYRQHCTFRGGNYIKDISAVEPDLSKVMIVDNSPSSYVFHEDNAIPIEGWISDPTDNDLLHLVPLLEALQHVTDVRALLALRGGEPAAV